MTQGRIYTESEVGKVAVPIKMGLIELNQDKMEDSIFNEAYKCKQALTLSVLEKAMAELYEIDASETNLSISQALKSERCEGDDW